MSLDQAIKRILWRFQNFNTIYVNEKDVTAVNKIIDFVNQHHDKTVTDNLHFSKLYIYVLGTFLDRYETTIDHNLPRVELHKLIDRPLEYFIEDITSKTNFRLQTNLLEASGFNSKKHPLMIDEHEKKTYLSNMQKLVKIESNMNALFGKAWSLAEVRNGLKIQIINYLDGVRENKQK